MVSFCKQIGRKKKIKIILRIDKIFVKYSMLLILLVWCESVTSFAKIRLVAKYSHLDELI